MTKKEDRIITVFLIIIAIAAMFSYYSDLTSYKRQARKSSKKLECFIKSNKDIDQAILKLKLDESVNIKDYMKSNLELSKDEYNKHKLEDGKALLLESKMVGSYIFNFKLNLESKSELGSLYNLKDKEEAILKVLGVKRRVGDGEGLKIIEVSYKLDGVNTSSKRVTY